VVDNCEIATLTNRHKLQVGKELQYIRIKPAGLQAPRHAIARMA
jgi:hypothetical protein